MEATKDYRAELAALMRATVADEAAHHDWTYDAIRPLTVPPRPWKPGMRVVGDCSKGVQFLSWWLEMPDPMNLNYGPYGNSQTLCMGLQHLTHTNLLLIGDVVTFGADGDEHAARVLEAGADPLLWSFGHQGAPNTYRLSQDGREAQYLRVPIPLYVPTPQDVLRSKTTWFAWVAWRLGEGDWRGYGPSAAAVRPDVPKTIPAGWWSRLQDFEANRYHGNPKGAPR